MHRLGFNSGRRTARSVIFAVALLSLVFLLQLASHAHANGQEEAACRICQAAHVNVTPVVSGIVLSVPLVPVGEVASPSVSAASESFFHHSDPRAPPSEVQL
jgi:hypothetical protein